MFGKQIERSTKPKYEWPDCAPIDKSDPYWEFNNNCNSNGTAYKKQEVEPGRWQWVVDEEAERLSRQWEQSKSDLWWALRTRVLTDDEMLQVRQHDYHLLTRPMQSYNLEELKREFNEALVKQAYLQLEARRDSSSGPTGEDTVGG